MKEYPVEVLRTHNGSVLASEDEARIKAREYADGLDATDFPRDGGLEDEVILTSLEGGVGVHL